MHSIDFFFFGFVFKLQFMSFFFAYIKCCGCCRVLIHFYALIVMRSLPCLSFQNEAKKAFSVCGCQGGSITTSHVHCLICTNWS